MHQTQTWRCRFVDQDLEEFDRLAARDIVVEVEHVKAHPHKER